MSGEPSSAFGGPRTYLDNHHELHETHEGVVAVNSSLSAWTWQSVLVRAISIGRSRYLVPIAVLRRSREQFRDVFMRGMDSVRRWNRYTQCFEGSLLRECYTLTRSPSRPSLILGRRDEGIEDLEAHRQLWQQRTEAWFSDG